MSADKCEVEEDFGEVVAVGDGVHGVGGDAVEAEFAGDSLAVEVDGRTRQGSRAEGGDVEPLAGVGEAAEVAGEHLDVGEEMMADGDGLATLEVGVARDGVFGVLVGLAEKGFLKADDEIRNIVDGFAAIETGVGGDLVIAGAGGVELGAGGADVGGEGGLDIEVDVFEFGGELELAFFNPCANGEKTGLDFREFVLGQNTRSDLSAGVGDGATDIVLVEAPIKGDGFSELLDEICGLLSEAAFPHKAGMLSGFAGEGKYESSPSAIPYCDVDGGSSGVVGVSAVNRYYLMGEMLVHPFGGLLMCVLQALSEELAPRKPEGAILAAPEYLILNLRGQRGRGHLRGTRD